MTERPRVFVSSVMEGFRDQRAAARGGIVAANCEPVLIDDSPSLDTSSRNACLDGVASCDAIVVIIGDRGGWAAPSGKLVVHEEYDHAVAKSIPTLVFLQQPASRDDAAEHLAAHLTEYVHGRFRKAYSSCDDLSQAIEAALRNLFGARGAQMMDDPGRMATALTKPAEFGGEPVLRVVIAPARADETVIPVEDLDGADFRYEFVRIGTDRSVGLFDQNAARSIDRGRSSLIVKETGSDRREGTACVELTEDGWLTVDLRVSSTSPTSRTHPLAGYGFVPVIVEELADHAARILRFVAAVYDYIDPHSRHARLYVNASLGSLHGRPIALERQTANAAGGVVMSLGGEGSNPPTSFDRPEPVSRAASGWISECAQRIAARLERRVNT